MDSRSPKQGKVHGATVGRAVRSIIRWLVAAAVFAPFVTGQMPPPPKFTTDSVVHGASFLKGSFAPNTFISIFGENLSWSTLSVKAGSLNANTLPTSLGGVQVLIGPTLGFLVFVSPGQINALIDSRLTPGTYPLRVLRDSLAGPSVATVTIAETAPGLFAIGDGEPVVTRPDGSLVSAESPARPGEIIILWATGLGSTLPSTRPGELPRGAAPLNPKTPFQVLLNGVPIPNGHVLYAGVAPGFAGLYQINILLPEDTPRDPAIRIGFEGVLSLVNQVVHVMP